MKKSKFSKGGLISILFGLFSFILVILVYAFRPFQSCNWYDVFCNGSSYIFSPIVYVLMVLFILLGFLLFMIGTIAFLVKLITK